MRPKLCFLNLPICSFRGRPMNKNTLPGPSVDRGIRIVRLLKQVFQPYRVMSLDNKFQNIFCVCDEYVINLFVCIYEVRKGT
jgi:hypothetical protein